MVFLRVLSAELLKLKRTIALRMVIVAPLIIPLLTCFGSVGSGRWLNVAGVSNEWNELTNANFQFWSLVALPLYVTIATALIAGVDHSGNHWKSIFARPVPRWTLYVSKLLVAMGMIAASTLIIVGGILAVGTLLPVIRPELVFGPPVPWVAILRRAVQIWGLAFLSLVIQHWVSLRWQSFSVATGFGAIATVMGVIVSASKPVFSQSADWWPQYFPWTLPMLVLTGSPTVINVSLWIGWAAGAILATVGCVDFCTREVT